MIPFDKNTLDLWLSDYDEFNDSFRSFCNAHMRVHAVHADYVPNVTRQIHAQWVADHKFWIENEMDAPTVALSHVKICALLLASLVSEAFLGNLHSYEYNEEEKYEFRGTPAEKEQAKKDLLDGREASLGLDFVILIIHWYEKNRTDRASPFIQPLTVDMRHDLLNYVLSEELEKRGLYLILKALYLRPPGNGAVN